MRLANARKTALLHNYQTPKDQEWVTEIIWLDLWFHLLASDFVTTEEEEHHVKMYEPNLNKHLSQTMGKVWKMSTTTGY